MKNLIILAHCFLLSGSLFSQFGVRLKYNKDDYNHLARILDSSTMPFSTSYEMGIDYWKRFKNFRVEFYPEVGFRHSESFSSELISGELKNRAFIFNLNTNLYVLDFSGDCDCPTFSKEGGLIKKGFHFMVSPGLEYNSYQSVGESLTENGIKLNFSVGIGLDIGVNELVTLTPFVMVKYGLDYTWNRLGTFLGMNELDYDRTSMQLGLRLGFRPDYTKSRRF